ncbi:MAG TPA: hypothetical protein VMY05_02605 [Acidobacteriota bacterium]|nr:hypothetical protein [Acidobacteriota bacterium]
METERPCITITRTETGFRIDVTGKELGNACVGICTPESAEAGKTATVCCKPEEKKT